MKKYRLAIVGATGVVGRTILKVLEEEDLPISEYVLFSSKKSAGKKINFFDKTYIVQGLNELSFDSGFDFAIFSAGSSTSIKYAPIASSKNCIVIDNSSAFRMDKDVPLIVPEVNPEEIPNNKGIIANPNCSTIQAVLPLKALDEKYVIKRIVYSTYQAVSGAGKDGIMDLENGIQNYIKNYKNSNFEFKDSYNLKKFNYPIFSNCLPHIDKFLDNGYTKEEEKMINETRKILKKPNLPITATTVRVPVFNSHSESINVEFENSFDLKELVNTLTSFPGIVVEDNLVLNDFKGNITSPVYPLATSASGHNDVFVGRIRKDFSVKYGVNLWVVADNIRKGAATNAVQILKELIKS